MDSMGLDFLGVDRLLSEAEAERKRSGALIKKLGIDLKRGDLVKTTGDVGSGNQQQTEEEVDRLSGPAKNFGSINFAEQGTPYP